MYTEKAMATHSSTVAWKIPWMEEPGRLQSMGSLRVWTRLSDFTFTFHFHALEKEMASHSSVLAWRIPGTGEPGGLPSMGSHRVGHDWSDLAQHSISREAVMDHDEERRFRGWTAWAQILIMPLSVSQCPHLLILVNNIPYLVGLFGFR